MVMNYCVLDLVGFSFLLLMLSRIDSMFDCVLLVLLLQDTVFRMVIIGFLKCLELFYHRFSIHSSFQKLLQCKIFSKTHKHLLFIEVDETPCQKAI